MPKTKQLKRLEALERLKQRLESASRNRDKSRYWRIRREIDHIETIISQGE